VTQVLPELNSQMADAFFDYDRSALRPDAISVLRQDAAILLPILAEFPQLKVMVEGHCDERGSAEYNLGLGDHRARGVVEVLQGFGVPLANVEIISYGKERPQCTEPAESCWRLNRRAHLEVRAGGATE
jgi:peptidoglycan-associated lipoprotein